MPNQSGMDEFLKEANVIVLSTMGPNNQPHAVPVWYLYEDGAFLISAGEGSQKHKNIQRNPKVSLVAERRNVPYYAILVHGEAEVGPALPNERRLELAIRYLGEERGKVYAADLTPDGSISIRVRPTKVIEYRGWSG